MILIYRFIFAQNNQFYVLNERLFVIIVVVRLDAKLSENKCIKNRVTGRTPCIVQTLSNAAHQWFSVKSLSASESIDTKLQLYSGFRLVYTWSLVRADKFTRTDLTLMWIWFFFIILAYKWPIFRLHILICWRRQFHTKPKSNYIWLTLTKKETDEIVERPKWKDRFSGCKVSRHGYMLNVNGNFLCCRYRGNLNTYKIWEMSKELERKNKGTTNVNTETYNIETFSANQL